MLRPRSPGRCNGDEIKDHPYADILPLLEGEAFDSLAADFRANGLLEPITIHEGLILDGRNRSNACKAAGVKPHFLEFEGDDPLAFVLSLNLHRRHLTPSQCAMVGADLATMRQGARTDLRQPSASLPEVSQTQARLSTASERGIRSAVFVKKKGSQELVQAVRDGKIAVSLAARLATASEAIQQRAVAEPERVHAFAKQACAVSAYVKESHRPQRELFKQCSSASHTGWKRSASRCELANRRSSPGICCARIVRPIARSGGWSDAA